MAFQDPRLGDFEYLLREFEPGRGGESTCDDLAGLLQETAQGLEPVDELPLPVARAIVNAVLRADYSCGQDRLEHFGAERLVAIAERLPGEDNAALLQLDVAKAAVAHNDLLGAADMLERAIPTHRDSWRVVELLTELADVRRLLGEWAACELLLQELDLELEAHSIDEANRDLLRFRAIGVRLQYCVDLGLLDLARQRLIDMRGAYRSLTPIHQKDERGVLLLGEAAYDLATERFEAMLERLPGELDRDAPLADSIRRRLELYLGLALAELGESDPALRERAREQLLRALGSASDDPGVELAASAALARLALGDSLWPEARAHLTTARERLLTSGRGVPDSVPHHEAQLAALEARLALGEGAGPGERTRRLELLEQAFDRFLGHWASTPRRAGGIGFLHYMERRAVLSDLILLTLEVHGRRAGAKRALVFLIRAQALGTLARGMDVGVPLLDQVRTDLIGQGAGALVYLPGPVRTYAFAIDGRSVECFELPASPVWEEDRATWTALLKKSPRDLDDARLEELAGAGRRLAAVILPPELRDHIANWSELSLVGLDLLRYLPFEALPLEDDVPLGLTYAVAHLPSFPVACHLARVLGALPPPQPDETWLLLLAAPKASAEALEYQVGEDLIWSDDDTRRTVRSYPEGRWIARVGGEADYTLLGDLDRRRVRVLHLVTHGISRGGEDERPAGLVLSEGKDGAGARHGGLVWAEDVEGLSAPRLVLLSACRAGGGELRVGDDGVGHLGGAFFRAGALCVVLSPADLEFESTKVLMWTFHERLRRGDSPAVAMLAARRAVAEDPQHASAFYHGLVHVTGLGFAPVFAGAEVDAESADGSGWLMAGGLAALAAVLAAVLVSRRRAAA